MIVKVKQLSGEYLASEPLSNTALLESVSIVRDGLRTYFTENADGEIEIQLTQYETIDNVEFDYYGASLLISDGLVTVTSESGSEVEYPIKITTDNELQFTGSQITSASQGIFDLRVDNPLIRDFDPLIDPSSDMVLIGRLYVSEMVSTVEELTLTHNADSIAWVDGSIDDGITELIIGAPAIYLKTVVGGINWHTYYMLEVSNEYVEPSPISNRYCHRLFGDVYVLVGSVDQATIYGIQSRSSLLTYLDTSAVEYVVTDDETIIESIQDTQDYEDWNNNSDVIRFSLEQAEYFGKTFGQLWLDRLNYLKGFKPETFDTVDYANQRIYLEYYLSDYDQTVLPEPYREVEEEILVVYLTKLTDTFKDYYDHRKWKEIFNTKHIQHLLNILEYVAYRTDYEWVADKTAINHTLVLFRCLVNKQYYYSTTQNALNEAARVFMVSFDKMTPA